MAKNEAKGENLGSMAKGIEASINGNILTVTVDLTQDHGPSKSGKTVVVGTTSGTCRLSNGMLFSMNVNRK